jgi:hypothetical protein
MHNICLIGYNIFDGPALPSAISTNPEAQPEVLNPEANKETEDFLGFFLSSTEVKLRDQSVDMLHYFGTCQMQYICLPGVYRAVNRHIVKR